MALIKCSECGQEISDKAKKCIKCGCPIIENNSVVNDKEEVNNVVSAEAIENNNVFKNVIVLIIACVLIFGPIFFIVSISKPDNSWDAIFFAKQEVGNGILESEIDFKIYSKRNDKYIVECNTTNYGLKILYGPKFYFGYYKDVTGKNNYHYISEDLQEVKKAINYDIN